MKKLLFAFGSVAAMLIISSCSSDNFEDATKENSINKEQISPSATINTIPLDTIPQTNDDPIDDKNPPLP